MNTLRGAFSWIGARIGLGSSGFWAWWGGKPNYSGETVTLDSAMSIAAVWSGVTLTAGTVGTLPGCVYVAKANSVGMKVEDLGNPYYNVLCVQPNADQTPVEFWEGMVACMLVLGDGFARKIRINGKLVAMRQMDPTRMTVKRANGVLTYYYDDYDGTKLTLTSDDVFHLKGFSFGGDRGLSVIQYGANSLGATLAADKTAGKMFKSGLSSSGFIQTKQVLNPEDRDKFTKLMGEYQGSDNAGKLMILEGDMTYTPISMKAGDAELLASRGFNIEEIARWLKMPPILIGHSSEGQTMWGTGVQQIIQAWYVLGLRQILTRIEEAVNLRVIEVKDRGTYYFKFNVNGLLRGDPETQARIASIRVQNGLDSRNEQRALDDLPPIPEGEGGDLYTAQINLGPLAGLGGDKNFPNTPADQIDRAVTAMVEAAVTTALANFLAQAQQQQPAPVPKLPAPKPRPTGDDK